MGSVDKFESQKHREYKKMRQSEKEVIRNRNVKYYDLEPEEDFFEDDDLLPYHDDEYDNDEE